MGWSNRIAAAWKALRGEAMRRKFEGAQIGRLAHSWTTQNLAIDEELKRDLDKLRARSRDLAQNNDVAKKFLQMVSTHVVGPTGFALQVVSKNANGDPDQRANEVIEQAFAAWAKRGVCEMSRKLSFVDIQHLAVKAIARDGEALVRKVYGGAANRFQFGLQMLDVDRLATTKNEQLANGNAICMGVEFSRVGEPIAYYLHRMHPGSASPYTYTDRTLERVPAADVYHLFVPERAEQNRGIPWMHAAMMRLNNLGAFEEAAIIAARVGAAKMGFFQSPEGSAQALADGKDATTGELHMDAEPGDFRTLPPGFEFAGWDPAYPHAHYEAFIKACLRTIASGLGVAYHTLSSDLEGVNFSSARAGTLEERDNWMVIQGWFIEAFLEPLFADWLRMALLSGQITFSTGSPLPIEKLDKFNAPAWQGRRWQWVDPEKDIAAAILAIENNLKTRREVIAEQGRDIEDVWNQLAKEKEKAKTLGLELKPRKPEKPAAKPGGGKDGEGGGNAQEDGEGRGSPVVNVTVAPPAVTVNAPVTVPERQVTVNAPVTVPERHVTLEATVEAPTVNVAGPVVNAYPRLSEETIHRDERGEMTRVVREAKD